MGGFVLAEMPHKRVYKPGENITFEGIKFTCDDQDVTTDVALSVAEGTIWRASDSKLDIIATYGQQTCKFTLTRSKRKYLLLVPLTLLLLVSICAGVYVWMSQPEQGDTGSYIIPQGEMTDEEAQAMLDDQAEKSRITVSLSPNPRLQADGQLRVNFVVVPPNNGYAERLEVEQDGQIVYKSGVVEPGYKVEWGQSAGAHAGDATATVYAVDGEGLDHGNPISVEVVIETE